MDLLLEIVHCPNIEICLENPDINHPCGKIVSSQNVKKIDEFKVPEPWSGHLEEAPILFFSLSPFIDPMEEYPTSAWPDYIIRDFFINRFGGGLKLWVKNELHPLLKDGTHKKEWVRYWAEVRKRTKELLDKKEVKPGVDFVIYPLVHCKVQGEYGIKEALHQCIERYLYRTLAQSNAKVIVCLGKETGQIVRRKLNIPLEVNPYGPVQIGKRQRYIVCSQHPNARRVPHSLQKILSQQAFEKLKEFLKTDC